MKYLFLILCSKKSLKILLLSTLGLIPLLNSCNSGSSDSSPLVSIETVPVMNMGNESDTETGFGKVDYNFAIGKYIITVGQYLVFLNTKASVTDKQAIIDLWNIDMEDPASYVSDGFIKRTGSGTIYIYIRR